MTEWVKRLKNFIAGIMSNFNKKRKLEYGRKLEIECNKENSVDLMIDELDKNSNDEVDGFPQSPEINDDKNSLLRVPSEVICDIFALFVPFEDYFSQKMYLICKKILENSFLTEYYLKQKYIECYLINNVKKQSTEILRKMRSIFEKDKSYDLLQLKERLKTEYLLARTLTTEEFIESMPNSRIRGSISGKTFIQKVQGFKSLITLYHIQDVIKYVRKAKIETLKLEYKGSISQNQNQSLFSIELETFNFGEKVIVSEKKVRYVSLDVISNESIYNMRLFCSLSYEKYKFLRECVFGKMGMPSWYEIESLYRSDLDELRKKIFVKVCAITGQKLGIVVNPNLIIEDLFESEEILMDLIVRTHWINSKLRHEEELYHHYCKSNQERIRKQTQISRIRNEIQELKLAFSNRRREKIDELQKIEIEKQITLKEREIVEEKSMIKQYFHKYQNQRKIQDLNDMKLTKDEKFEIEEYFQKDLKTKDQFSNAASKYIRFEKSNDEEIDVIVHTIVKLGKDGHIILKQGFAKSTIEEILMALNLPIVSRPYEPHNFKIFCMLLMKENFTNYHQNLKEISDYFDKTDGKVIEKTFNVNLSQITGEKVSLGKFLLDNNVISGKKRIIRNKMKCGLPLSVKLCSHYVIGEDWKGFLLCFQKPISEAVFYSPFSVKIAKFRKSEELDMKSNFSVIEIFDHGYYIGSLLLRGNGHLIFMKNVGVLRRPPDQKLHGSTAQYKCSIYYLILLSGAERMGLKQKFLNVLEKYELLKQNSQVTNKKGVRIKPKKMKHYVKNSECRDELGQLIDHKRDSIFKKLNKKKEENAEREKRGKTETKIYKATQKTIKSYSDILNQSNELRELLNGFFDKLVDLVNILDRHNVFYKGENPLRQFFHSKEHIDKQFFSFEYLKDVVVPKIEDLRIRLIPYVKRFDRMAMYMNLMLRELAVFLTYWWNCGIFNQDIQELLNYLMNLEYNRSNKFGGHEPKDIKYPVFGSENEEFVESNRRLETMVACLLKQSKRKELKASVKKWTND